MHIRICAREVGTSHHIQLATASTALPGFFVYAIHEDVLTVVYAGRHADFVYATLSRLPNDFANDTATNMIFFACAISVFA